MSRLPISLLASILTLVSATSAFPQSEKLTWNADSLRSRLTEGEEYMVLAGNAVFQSGSTMISADEIEASGSDFRYVYCTGSVRVYDAERGIRLKSERLFYDRELEITRIDGYAEMQDLTNEVVVKGGYFEYLGQEELVIIQIGVRILKITADTELTCRAELARFNRKTETLELTGLPRVTRNNDQYAASRIVINLDTDEIVLEEGVSGSIVDSGDEE